KSSTFGDVHRASWPFDIHITFLDAPPPCKCSCCEYRQYVHGTETRNGEDVTPPDPGSGRINKDKDVEDYAFAPSDKYGYKKGEVQHYGHRETGEKNTNPSNQYCGNRGCEYKGHDALNIPWSGFDTWSIDLHFTGKIIDVCNGNAEMAGFTQTWDVN